MNKVGRITCEIFDFEDDKNHGEVRIYTEECNNEFKCLMMCAEFLTHLVAQKSNSGYEKALDLIRKGAMTYNTTRNLNVIE